MSIEQVSTNFSNTSLLLEANHPEVIPHQQETGTGSKEIHAYCPNPLPMDLRIQ
jgi:hypothetical protein